MAQPTSADASITLADGTKIEDLAEFGNSFSDPELEKRIDELMKLSDLNKLKARYKIGILFMEDRSRNAAYKGAITFWHRTEGADTLLYLCSQSPNGKPCNNLMLPATVSAVADTSVCTKCGIVASPRTLTGHIGARLTTQNWAALVTRALRLVEGNADLELTYMRASAHRAEQSYHEDKDRGKSLERFHAGGDSITYTLARLVADVGNGNTINRAVRAFLEA
jgi:hypothetical protein